MKPRFIKEYANYRYSEFDRRLMAEDSEKIRIAINAAMERCLKIPSLYERGFINVDEAMKSLTNLDNYYNELKGKTQQ